MAAFAQVLTHTGILKAIQEQVRFARTRFGSYDLIDFVAVLIETSSSKTLRRWGIQTGEPACQPRNHCLH